MKPVFKIPAIVLLVIAIIWLFESQYHFIRGILGAQALGQRELAAQYLGKQLAQRFQGKAAVVLSNPFSQKKDQPRNVYQFEKAGLAGLRNGLGAAVKIDAIAFPELRAEFLQNPASVYIDPATTTPLSYVVAEDALDKLSREHPNAELWISLIGLPVNIRRTELWKRAHFGLLLPDLRMVGTREEIVDAVKSRKIEAMVLVKPGAPPEDQPLGRDLETEFDRRFVLVTAETVDSVLKAFPRLF